MGYAHGKGSCWDLGCEVYVGAGVAVEI